MTTSDHAWMARALQLARKGLYSTHPNPRVGCVIVRDGERVGEGWHVRAGEPHAEVHALRQADFNITACARHMQVSRVTVYRLCRKHQLALPELR